MGKWLVDLGRDYPLTPQADASDADAELTLAFMRAAVRIEPNLAEGYLWQHDLLWALHREDKAREMLGKYARLEPDDWSAWVFWIAAMTDSLQTLEERVRLWEGQLRQAGLPGEVASDLHRRMALYHFNRNDLRAAQQSLDLALKAFPHNLSARRLRVDMTAASDDPAPRVALALEMVRMSPGNGTLAWDLALLLDDLSMHREAQPWYTHALTMFQRTRGEKETPSDFLLDMAASKIGAGQLDAAETLVRDLLKSEPDSPIPHRLLARIARLRNQPDVAAAELRRARAAYDAAWSKAGDDADLAAEIAWFHCVEDRDIGRACEMAEIAMRADAPDDVARRSYGWALAERVAAEATTQPAVTRPSAKEGPLDKARRVLDGVAGTDAWAAIAQARVKELRGDRKGAVAILTRVAERHPSGPVFEEASARLAGLGAPVPPGPGYEAVRKLLADFDESILLFPTDPRKFVELTVTPLTATVKAGRPIWCRFSLKNRSPHGISLGENLMVNPFVLVRVRSTGDRDRDYDAIMRVAMNRRQLLAPGQSIEVTQTIDVGPLRGTLIGTPQVTQEIDVTAILNPTFSDEKDCWVAGPGGLEAGPARIRREGILPDDPTLGLAATLAAGRSDSPAARAEALERLMMWLAEREHLRAGRLRYPAQPVDAGVLTAAVLERFADPAWEVRAHLAEALRWIVLDAELAKRASGLLADPHWLVRMLTVRLFADQQGARFDKVAAYYQANDADPLVRDVAAAVRQRWAAATQPATAPAGTR